MPQQVHVQCEDGEKYMVVRLEQLSQMCTRGTAGPTLCQLMQEARGTPSERPFMLEQAVITFGCGHVKERIPSCQHYRESRSESNDKTLHIRCISVYIEQQLCGCIIATSWTDESGQKQYTFPRYMVKDQSRNG